MAGTQPNIMVDRRVVRGNTYSPFRLKYDLIIYIFSYPMAGTLPNIMVDWRDCAGNTYSTFRLKYDLIT